MSEDRQDQGKRKCPNCGAEVLPTDDVCMNCGAELVVSPSPEPVEPETPAAPTYAVTQPPREEPVETGKIRVVQALVLSWRGFISHIALLVLGALVMSLMGVCVVLIPPLMAGLYAMSLSAVRGHEPELGDIFGGFSYTVPAYAVVIVMAIIFLVINLLLVAPLVAAWGLTGEGNLGEGFGVQIGTLVTLAVTALVSIVVFAPLLGLAMPAVAEGMGAVDALAFSLNRGLANWPALFALSIIVGVVTTLISSITGGLAQFLTTPWSFCVMSAAYMQAIGDVTEEGV